eukprot:11560838-Karenia_brevis.AAC.1
MQKQEMDDDRFALEQEELQHQIDTTLAALKSEERFNLRDMVGNDPALLIPSERDLKIIDIAKSKFRMSSGCVDTHNSLSRSQKRPEMKRFGSTCLRPSAKIYSVEHDRYLGNSAALNLQAIWQKDRWL